MQCACRQSGSLLGILLVPILLLPGLAPAQSASVSIDALYARADSLTEAGSTDAALALYGQILERDSTEISALYDRADLYAQQERYAEAAQAAKQIQQIDTVPSSQVLGRRGWYLILAGNPK